MLTPLLAVVTEVHVVIDTLVNNELFCVEDFVILPMLLHVFLDVG